MPRKPEEPWFERVANRMVQEGKSFPQACSEENVFLNTSDADKQFKRASFQKCLRQSRHRYHNEIARDPERNKTTLIGQLQVCADKLMGEGSFDKAAEVLLKIAKIESWINPDNQVNVFGTLTQNDIDKARAVLKDKVSNLPSITN